MIIGFTDICNVCDIQADLYKYMQATLHWCNSSLIECKILLTQLAHKDEPIPFAVHHYRDNESLASMPKYLEMEHLELGPAFGQTLLALF